MILMYGRCQISWRIALSVRFVITSFLSVLSRERNSIRPHVERYLCVCGSRPAIDTFAWSTQSASGISTIFSFIGQNLQNAPQKNE